MSRRLARAASITEYALLLVGVLLLGAGAYRMLGPSLGRQASSSGAELSSGGGGGGSGSGGGGGGISGGGGGGGGGGGIAAKEGVGEKSSVGSKASMGGMGGTGGAAAAGGGTGANGDVREYEASNGAVDNSHGDLLDDIRFKRAIGLAFLAAGALAISYVIVNARQKQKAADQGDEPPPH